MMTALFILHIRPRNNIANWDGAYTVSLLRFSVGAPCCRSMSAASVWVTDDTLRIRRRGAKLVAAGTPYRGVSLILLPPKRDAFQLKQCQRSLKLPRAEPAEL